MLVVGTHWEGNAGAAYVFRHNGSTWVQEQKLTASDGATEDRFGEAVDVNGPVIVVAAWLEDHGGKSGAGAA